jgi:hypothetical protein
VLRVAVPATLRAGLPSAVRSLVEEEVEEEGAVQVLHEDRPDGDRYLYFLDTAAERLSLHFAAHPPDLQTGSRVRVRGVRVKGALALGSGNDKGSVEVLSAPLANTFGEQKTLVILVNFSDLATQPYTVSQAQDVVFNTTSAFHLENSYEQTWLGGAVAGWFTIALSGTVCDYNTLATQAKSAATAAGFNVSAYKRLVYGFPKNACGFLGLGTVGGSPSQAWINGEFSLGVVAHEMGHNLGLYHSHSLECGTTAVSPSGCGFFEYGDMMDAMGNEAPGHFNAAQKERLGWLGYGTSPPVTTVQAEGTYLIEPIETPGVGAKALKILKSTDPSTGKKTWYYLELRQAIGFDDFLSSNGNVLNGVVVHLGTESTGNSIYLLDMTPASQMFSFQDWSDPGLVVGRSYDDSDSGMTMTPVSVGPEGAIVNVSFGPLACVRANPSVAPSPSESQWVPAGTPVTYTVTVTNADNDGCGATTFSLVGAVPDGWGAALGATTLTLEPGASGSTAFQVTSPASAADGFYPVGVTATSSAAPSYAASASATYVVAASLDVAAATDKSSYPRNQDVTVTAAVAADGAPVSGASVTFTITKTNGAKVTATATTGANGSAVYKYRLRKNDPVGPYQAGVRASLNGALSGQAATSFMVQ